MQAIKEFPQAVKNVLWSYDLTKIDFELHKNIIIAQVLNFGSKEATDWLFQTYSEKEIGQVANQIPTGQWDKKSLALWSLYLGIHPTAKPKRVGYA